MLSRSEARYTGLAISAHVPADCSGNIRKTWIWTEDVLRSRGQGNIILKPKQKEALQSIVFKGQDCLIVLPTGYGKSLIYQMLPSLFDKISARNLSSKDKSIVIVVSPLNALIDDQINKLKSAGVNCTSLRVCGDEVDGAFEEKILEDLQAGKFELIFTHPEVAVSNRHCRDLFLSAYYQRNVRAVVVDEAHCIIEWGHNFREDYRKLGTLSSVFPTAKIVAMTATATKEYQTSIMKSLNMKDPKLVITNPDRPNIFYEVQQRPSYLKQSNINQFEEILSPIADELVIANIKMPVTIIYSSLEMCGVGYAFLERKLGDHQFYPIGAPQIPQNRLFAQFHSPQTDKMKHELISSIVSESCKQRVIFATVAFGMGVDSPCVERIIHFGVPRTMESFFQESGRAGRDGRPATSTLYFNNNDIGANVEGMQPIMRDYCKNPQNVCRRKIVLSHFGFGIPSPRDKHSCCNTCRSNCECSECVELHQDVLALENIHIPANEFLLSGKQVEDIKSELIKYKEEIEASDNYLNLSMCSGLTMTVIDDVCSTLQELCSLDRIMEKLPVWRKEHAEKIVQIISNVTSK